MNKITPSLEGRFRFLIEDRIKNFWGYGNLKSDIWFIGMEEGADGDIKKLIKRFESTSLGKVSDICEDMQDSEDHLRWFKEGAPTQSTYRKLIYLLIYFHTKKEPTLEDIREFQIKHFGRKKNNHAVLELMPLPAKSLQAKDWVYADSGVEGLESRRAYIKRYKPERVARLRKLIEEHKPKLVICYSMVYFDDWQVLTGKPLKKIINGKLYMAKDNGTMYAVVPHSVAHSVSNNDWSHIAKSIIKAV